jgi:hypothetical protein
VITFPEGRRSSGTRRSYRLRTVDADADRPDNLSIESQRFRSTASKTRRRMWFQNAKVGLLSCYRRRLSCEKYTEADIIVDNLLINLHHPPPSGYHSRRSQGYTSSQREGSGACFLHVSGGYCFPYYLAIGAGSGRREQGGWHSGYHAWC